MDRLVVPGVMPLTTTPSSVPLPFTPGVFGCRVAEMIAWPWSLSARCTIAISCVPPERNPPWRTSSTWMTDGLYCSSIGTEYRSVTLSTTTPMVAVCPGERFIVGGSNRIRGPETCAWGVAAEFSGATGEGFVCAGPDGAPGATPAGPCDAGLGFEVGAFTSISRLAPGNDSVPAE